MNKRTAIYCRTDTLDPEGIARQRTALQQYAGEQGFENLVFYEDNGLTVMQRRPEFIRLEQDIQDGKVARLLTTSVSRIERNIAVVMRWIVWLRRHGVEIYTLDDRADWNPLLAALEKDKTNDG